MIAPLPLHRRQLTLNHDLCEGRKRQRHVGDSPAQQQRLQDGVQFRRVAGTLARLGFAFGRREVVHEGVSIVEEAWVQKRQQRMQLTKVVLAVHQRLALHPEQACRTPRLVLLVQVSLSAVACGQE